MAEPAVAPACLPETASVYWRPRVDARRLQVSGRFWTATTFMHTVPLLVAAALLVALEPLSFPIAFILIAHAWLIPELYAKRGANVVRPQKAVGAEPERTALGLLGDLVGHSSRDLHERTGLILERAGLGVWLVAEAGAVLVRPGGRRLYCYCVRADAADLPRADRIAHLLLALREDEAGFATVANLAFSGAPWRLRRRLPRSQRPAVNAAVQAARAVQRG